MFSTHVESDTPLEMHYYLRLDEQSLDILLGCDMQDLPKTSTTSCRICNSRTIFFSSSKVLEEIGIYSRCESCSSVQVENPTWLEFAHSRAISIFDTGLVSRCISASKMISTMLFLERKTGTLGFDWGGGTGLLTRLLRDRGYQAFSYDFYANSEHAAGFEVNLADFDKPSMFVSSIECFEHLTSPRETYKKATQNTQYFFFTTELICTPPPNPATEGWWYYIPESGQHVTFVSKLGLERFREYLGFQHYEMVGSLHIFSRVKLKFWTRVLMKNRISRALILLLVPELLNKRSSLTLSDKEHLMRTSK